MATGKRISIYRKYCPDCGEEADEVGHPSLQTLERALVCKKCKRIYFYKFFFIAKEEEEKWSD